MERPQPNQPGEHQKGNPKKQFNGMFHGNLL
jgi:hypothetical protein